VDHYRERVRSDSKLFLVYVVPEKQKLKNTDFPLIARILQGPCEQVSKVFLMEKDQVEEVTYDVSSLLIRWSVLRRVRI
jgi:Ras association domain-containing protein 2/4